MTRTKKLTFWALTDTEGNSKDAKGYAYGEFLPNEREMAEAYAKEHGLKVKAVEHLWSI